MRLFHYTTIEALAYIMNNRSLKFSRLDFLDDKTESEPFSVFNPLQYIFSCSFTYDPAENIPLWKMYANMETGIRLEFDSGTIFAPTLVKTTIPSNTQERCEYPPILYTAVKAEDIINEDYNLQYWDYPVEESLCSCIKLKKIIYDNDFQTLYKSKLYVHDEVNNGILTRSLNYDPLDYGYYKSKYWEFQKEIRSLIYASPFPRNKEEITKIAFGSRVLKTTYILVPLSKVALDNLKIVLAPKATEATRLIVESLTSELQNKSVSDSVLKNTIR